MQLIKHLAKEKEKTCRSILKKKKKKEKTQPTYKVYVGFN